MDRNDTETQIGRTVGNVLIFLPGLAVMMSSVLKFAGVPAVVHTMAAEGFAGGKLMLVATLEILSAALFLYPRTRALGVLVLSSFLGGAICTHLQMGEYAKAIGPCTLLTLSWIGIWLRHPQAHWSLPLGRAVRSRLLAENRPESWASKSA